MYPVYNYVLWRNQWRNLLSIQSVDKGPVLVKSIKIPCNLYLRGTNCKKGLLSIVKWWQCLSDLWSCYLVAVTFRQSLLPQFWVLASAGQNAKLQTIVIVVICCNVIHQATDHCKISFYSMATSASFFLVAKSCQKFTIETFHLSVKRRHETAYLEY